MEFRIVPPDISARTSPLANFTMIAAVARIREAAAAKAAKPHPTTHNP